MHDDQESTIGHFPGRNFGHSSKITTYTISKKASQAACAEAMDGQNEQKTPCKTGLVTSQNVLMSMTTGGMSQIRGCRCQRINGKVVEMNLHLRNQTNYSSE